MRQPPHSRPRHYVSGITLAVSSPLFRYSQGRDAHVLRLVGNKYGPVLRRERRKVGNSMWGGLERRRGTLMAGGSLRSHQA